MLPLLKRAFIGRPDPARLRAHHQLDGDTTATSVPSACSICQGMLWGWSRARLPRRESSDRARLALRLGVVFAATAGCVPLSGANERAVCRPPGAPFNTEKDREAAKRPPPEFTKNWRRCPPAQALQWYYSPRGHETC